MIAFNFLKDKGHEIYESLNNITLFTKMLMFQNIIMFILQLIFPYYSQISALLLNSSNNTIGSLNIYRIFTGIFINTSIFNLIISLTAWVYDSIIKENTQGTIRFLINFIRINLLLQTIYTLLMFILSFYFTSFGNKPSCGLWLILIFEIISNAINFPDSDLILGNDYLKINFKVYPILLVISYMIVNFTLVPMELIIGILMSVLYNYVLKDNIGDIYYISDDFVQKCEDCCLFLPLKQFNGIE